MKVLNDYKAVEINAFGRDLVCLPFDAGSLLKSRFIKSFDIIKLNRHRKAMKLK